MKQKPGRYTVIILALLAIIATVFAVVVTERGGGEAASSAAPESSETHEPRFLFGGATGWRKGPSNETSLALFGPNHDCFASVQYKDGSIAADKAERQKTDKYFSDRGYVATTIDTAPMTMRTTDGQQNYELHQSAVATPAGADKVKGGQEFGYLQLSSDHYLFVEGYCDTAEQLPTTIPALKAIKLNN
ncbi:MAG TPA: hypothetical protein VFG56_00935 [Candidatus Saccharimonadales bacterium]|nr:hypothetical protein [Candidatus Saccharimonadales bacterium]